MKDEENKKYVKLGITGVAVIVISLLCFFLLFRLRDVSASLQIICRILTPFLYGAVIAYILAPVCNRIEGMLVKLLGPEKGKTRLSQSVSIILSLLFALAIIWILFMLVIPNVWRSIISIANAIPAQLETANTWLHNLLKSQPDIQTYWDNFSGRMEDTIDKWLKTDLISNMKTVIEEVGFQLALFFGIVKNLFLGILISVYFLASRRQFAAQGKMLLNGIFTRKWAGLIEEEVRYADKMFNGFLMGKLLDSAIIGAICFVVTTLLGFESAALISVIVGVTNIIPFFGPFIGGIPSAFLLLLENPMHCFYFIIFIVILQQLDGNVIGPKILGNTTGLSSFWVLFSILLFGGMWGIVGMIIGVPLFAVIYDVVRRIIFYRLDKHECGGMIDEYNKSFHPVVVNTKPGKEKKDKKGTQKSK